LTVLKQVSLAGRRRYSCRCNCGKLTEVSANNLVRGLVISCGCALRGCNKLRPYEWLYNTLVREANERMLEIDIAYTDFVEFTRSTHCHYCDGEVWWKTYSEERMRGKHTRSYNLDRKDNLLGYLKSNVVVCCTRCNRAKNNLFTYDEWVRIGKIIATFGKENA
jgi:hypothetical protein